MKKHILSFVALVFVAQFLWADIEPSTSLTSYYAAVDNKSGDAIRTALFNKINSHTTVSYDNLKYLFQWTDTYNNAGQVIDDIYSYCDPAYVTSWCSGTCGYNREHSVPKSWFNEASTLYSDAFHMYPTNCYVNSFRGNLAFGECAGGSVCTTNGVQGKGRKGTSTFVGASGTSYASVGTVYEPDDAYKGDLARTYFYMVTCYMTNRFTYADGGVDMFTFENNKADLSPYSVELLLKWHRQDPVSERELARNEVIYGNTTYNQCQYSQGNRNPFIDYPELAEFIWGNRKGQPVNLAALVSGYDGGSGPVDPTPVIKHGVTWMVNGEELQVDSIVENGLVVNLPETPVSCSMESNMFMGWTDAPIDGTTDEAPAVLYVLATDIPVITEDRTLYAVFAHQVISENAAPMVYVFDEQNQNGWTNTAGKNGSYWLLVQGKYIESPAVDLAGLSSITMNIRTYGGSNNNTVSITAAGSEIATLTANNNRLNNYTWESDGTLSGVSPIRFAAEAHASQGVGFASITINATGAGVSYNRYITSCQGTTEVELLPAEAPVRKILVGGQIFIVREGKVYSLTGVQVR